METATKGLAPGWNGMAMEYSSWDCDWEWDGGLVSRTGTGDWGLETGGPGQCLWLLSHVVFTVFGACSMPKMLWNARLSVLYSSFWSFILCVCASVCCVRVCVCACVKWTCLIIYDEAKNVDRALRIANH